MPGIARTRLVALCPVAFRLASMRLICFSPIPYGLLKALSLFLSVISQMMWWVTPAEAQSIFQQLFGLAHQQQTQPAARVVQQRSPVTGAPAWIYVPPASEGPRQSRGTTPPEGSGSYTTVCVRMCDGFFFPVSQRVSRSRFEHDADVCRSRCGQSDSRLFYHSTLSGSIKDAVDLNGRSYALLPNAFLHRKKLVSGCACKPAPWSDASQMRHRQYALAEGISLSGRGIGAVTVVAGNYPDAAPTAAVSDEQPSAQALGEPNIQPDAASLQNQVAPKAVASRTPHASTPNQRQVAHARAQAPARAVTAPVRNPIRVASAQTSGLPLFGGPGGSKLRWPGDAR